MNSIIIHTLIFFFSDFIFSTSIGGAYGLWFNNDSINQQFFKMTSCAINLYKAFLLHCSRNTLEPFNIMVCWSPWAHPTVQAQGNWFQFSPQPLLLLKLKTGFLLAFLRQCKIGKNGDHFTFACVYLRAPDVGHDLMQVVDKFSLRGPTIPKSEARLLLLTLWYLLGVSASKHFKE